MTRKPHGKNHEKNDEKKRAKISKGNHSVQTHKTMYKNYKSYFLNKNLSLTW
jgi:hypothetical protein